MTDRTTRRLTIDMPDQSVGGSDVVDALQQVTSGAAVVVTGTVLGMCFNIVGRAMFTRTFTPSEYGVFSVGFTVVSIFTVVASLGLRNGVTRQIAYYRTDDGEKAGTIIGWGLLLSTATATVVAVALVLSADAVATGVFGSPEYALPLRIVAFGVPCYTLIRVATAVFRGFSRTRERVLFQEILQKASFPALLVPVVLLGLPYEWGIAAFPLSLGVTAVVYGGYVLRRNPGSFRTRVAARLRDRETAVELIRFSFPLLFAAILVQIMTWMDILMLGYFETPAVVGMYDAVRPLVRIVPIIWGAMIFMYTPLVSEYHADGSTESIRRIYFVLTKWFSSMTFPLTLVFVLFPEVVLGAVFGPEYTRASTALQILALAFFSGNLMGPNGATLTAIGETRVVMWANLVAAVMNVGLNVVLIPRLGLNGAAIATATALVVRNAIRVWLLYDITTAHSFRRPLLEPIALCSASLLAVDVALDGVFAVTAWMLPFVFALVVGWYVAAVRLTDNVGEADWAFVSLVANRLPIDPKRFEA